MGFMVDDKHIIVSLENLKRYNDKLHEELNKTFVKNERVERLEEEIENLKRRLKRYEY